MTCVTTFQAITSQVLLLDPSENMENAQLSQVEKEILADIEEDFASKSKRREFREKLAVRADRKKERQEERDKQQKLSEK